MNVQRICWPSKATFLYLASVSLKSPWCHVEFKYCNNSLWLQQQQTLIIPISGRTVPLRIWLPLEFPLEQPIAEIIETESMLRNPAGNLVENNKIQHKYLEEWNGVNQPSQLLQVLILWRFHLKTPKPKLFRHSIKQ